MNQQNNDAYIEARKAYEEAKKKADEARKAVILEKQKRMNDATQSLNNINNGNSVYYTQSNNEPINNEQNVVEVENVQSTVHYIEPKKEKKKRKSKKGTFLKFTAAVVLVGTFAFAGGIGLSYGQMLFENLKDNSTLASSTQLNVDNQENSIIKGENDLTDEPIIIKNETNEIEDNTSSTSNNEVVSVDNRQLLKDAMDTVVCVDVVTEGTNFFTGRTEEQSGAGSAVFYAEDEERVYLLTNNHVVAGASSVTITMDSAQDGKEVEAHLIGKDPATDTAVIFVYKEDLEKANIDYKLAVIGNSDNVDVFDVVYVIGNAAGEGKTQTNGSVSSISKKVATEDGATINAIQTDASVNPGNSGGALVNEKGELVGINFAKLVDSTIEGMGFAIPINTSVEVADKLIKEYNPDKPFIGISGGTISEEYKEKFELPSVGIIVADVISGGAGEEAGLQRNDLIVAVDDLKVETWEDLTSYLKNKKAGDKITLYFYRNNVPLSTVVKLGKYSDVNGGF